jgi:hypothetical protein
VDPNCTILFNLKWLRVFPAQRQCFVQSLKISVLHC